MCSLRLKGRRGAPSSLRIIMASAPELSPLRRVVPLLNRQIRDPFSHLGLKSAKAAQSLIDSPAPNQLSVITTHFLGATSAVTEYGNLL